MANATETYGYKGWMNSDSFMKRAFGVFGYSLVAGLIVQVVLFVIMLVVGLMFGGAAMLFSR